MPSPRIQGYYGTAAPGAGGQLPEHRSPSDPHGWSFPAIQRAVIDHLDAHQRMAGADRYSHLSPDRGRPIEP